MAPAPPARRVHRHRFARAPRPPPWAAALAERAARWPRVRAAPFFQWTGLYRGRRCFAALPRTLASRDLLLRLPRAHRDRLVAAGLARPYVRGSASGWARLRPAARGPTPPQLRLLRRAYEHAATGRA